MLNVKLSYHEIPGSFSEKESFINVYTASVMADDNAYDFVASAENYMLSLMPKGYFVNLADVDSIHLDKPWYARGFIDGMSIGSKLYMLTGSASINYLENMCVLYFNRNLLDDLGEELPYDTVRAGEWTFEKLNSLVKDCYADLNSNSEVDENDRFGYMTYNNMINAQLVSMGLEYITKNADGIPEAISALDERTIGIYDKVEAFMNRLDSTFHYIDSS